MPLLQGAPYLVIGWWGLERPLPPSSNEDDFEGSLQCHKSTNSWRMNLLLKQADLSPPSSFLQPCFSHSLVSCAWETIKILFTFKFLTQRLFLEETGTKRIGTRTRFRKLTPNEILEVHSPGAGLTSQKYGRASFARCSDIIFKTFIDAEPWWRIVNENLGHTHKFGDTHSLQSLRSSQERVPRGTGIQWVLITALNAMREDNEGRRMLSRQFKGDCKNQSAPWQHMKRLLSPIARGQKKWRTRPRLNHKGMKALRRLTPQS